MNPKYNDLEYIYRTEGLVTEEALLALECKLNTRLPADYRDFLKHFCDGVVQFTRLSFCETEEKKKILLSFFYTLIEDKDSPAFSLLNQYYSTRDMMPENFLPIIDNAANLYIVLATDKENYGKMYYWDEVNSEDEDTNGALQPLTFLGNSFTEWFQTIQSR